jgi:hypothetical protein
MPTNRTRRTRGRIGADGLTNDAYIFFKWNGTIANDFSAGKTKDEILTFWREHRRAIMSRYLEDIRIKGPGWAGKRPSFYLDELEAKERRRKTGTHEWIGQARSDGVNRTIIDDVFETDLQYLKRLGLLEPWEMEAAHADKQNAAKAIFPRGATGKRHDFPSNRGACAG